MCPEPLFHILGYGVNLYTLFYSLGLFPVFALSFLLARERGNQPARVLVGCAIGVISVLMATRWSVAGIILFVGSMGLFSALRPTRRARPLEALDIAFPPVALYQALARLGCFSAGCCHGKPAYGLPWAVTFSHPASACIYKGIPVHPTQLYQAAGNLVIFAILLALRNRPAFRGALLWVYLLSYGLLRFIVEFYRGDVRPMVGFLSLSQVVCIAFVLVGGVMLTRRFLAGADAGPRAIFKSGKEDR
jgi:hypothetical protein